MVTPEATTVSRGHEVTSALACPRCGGEPSPEGGPGHLARCSRCGTLGRIHDPEGRQRLLVNPGVSRETARITLERALDERGEGGELSVKDLDTLFVPYWRIQCALGGRVKGKRQLTKRVIERVYDDEGRPRTVVNQIQGGVEPYEREVEKLHETLIAACPLEEYGLPTLDNRRQLAGGLGVKRPLHKMGEVVVFEPLHRKLGTVLDPLVGRRDAREEAALLRSAWIDGLTAELLPGAKARVVTLSEDVTLLYYPVFVVRFSLGRRQGLAAVDATNGALVSLRLPEAEEIAQDRRLLSVVALASSGLAGSVLRFALAPPPAFHTPDAMGIRLRAGFAALVIGVGAVFGLLHLVRQLARRTP